MERKPVIGVTPYKRKEEPFDLYIPAGIIAAVERLGGEVRLLDYEKLRAYELIGEVVQLDGVIFAGGPDVDPSLYGEEKEPGCGEIIRRRDDMELNLFPLLLTRLSGDQRRLRRHAGAGHSHHLSRKPPAGKGRRAVFPQRADHGGHDAPQDHRKNRAGHQQLSPPVRE